MGQVDKIKTQNVDGQKCNSTFQEVIKNVPINISDFNEETCIQETDNQY